MKSKVMSGAVIWTDRGVNCTIKPHRHLDAAAELQPEKAGGQQVPTQQLQFRGKMTPQRNVHFCYLTILMINCLLCQMRCLEFTCLVLKQSKTNRLLIYY